jgi:dolichyl-phosphate mannosyltransferase polypeptide 3
MTRAQQTVSVLLLVSSVCPRRRTTILLDHLAADHSRSLYQLYLALYLGLVPLNETIQTEVVPVVSCCPFVTPSN